MVTGNFALLAGLDPDQVDEWYLVVYADAYEWVEMPNVRGMALHADGGIMGSKPYASSGAYINRMSDYCKSCHYNVKEAVGERACPFNALYWDFHGAASGAVCAEQPDGDAGADAGADGCGAGGGHPGAGGGLLGTDGCGGGGLAAPSPLGRGSRRPLLLRCGAAIVGHEYSSRVAASHHL